jgi:2-dehydro-3-deoxyphosphogluconate aldolase/(4S)-4-hydroxy-2-oxoglutarate aldolase
LTPSVYEAYNIDINYSGVCMEKTLEFIAKEKIIPVVKISNIEDTLPLMNALKAGGIGIAEITFRTACGADAIALASKNCPDMLIGAGTVVNAGQAKKAVENGAKFIVSPGYSQAVCDICKQNGILYLPGCVTPTEIMAAMDNGINIIKFFPAESYGGLAAIRAIASALPNIRFVPTGGIGLGNIKDYLSFDKVFACGGSWMVKESLIREGRFEEITKLCMDAKEHIGQ